MGGGDRFVDGDVLGGGVTIVPFVVGDSVPSGVGGEACIPEGGGEVCLPMEGRSAGWKGVVVCLLERGPYFGEDSRAS